MILGTDDIARAFLIFGQEYFIVPLLVIGLIKFNRKVFYYATCILLLSVIINYALKITFQIPLSPLLGKEGFAFPSGHMQSCVVLYGWLALSYPNILYRCLSVMLLGGIGQSLIHFGYHNHYDILGAIFFGVLIILLYSDISIKKLRLLPVLTLITATVLMTYIGLKHYLLGPRLWVIYALLIGFISTPFLYRKAKAYQDK